MFSSSASGESPPPPLPGDGTVSEFEPNVTSTIMQVQEGSGGDSLSVSDDRTLAVIE